jgi:hypothetical protein
MMYRLIDLPENVIGFKAQWEIRERDCEEVLIPSVENFMQTASKFSCLLVLNDFHQFKSSAIRILNHLIEWKSKLKKIAIVYESKTERKIIKLLGLLSPIEIRGFHADETDEAINWAAGHYKEAAVIPDLSI